MLINNIIVRHAEKNDIPEIYALVKQLAEYEKALNSVTASLDDYYHFFNINLFEALVAESDKKILGMCIYYWSFSTWRGRMLYLEDFCVNKDYRSLGIGQMLFDQILSISRENDAALAKWQVLDWNEPAIKFYEKNGAIIEKDWWNCKLLTK